MMNELERARERMEARGKAAQEFALWQQGVGGENLDAVQSDFEALMNHLEHLEQTAWDKYVPRRLMDVFGEVRNAIEDREGIRLDEARAFIYGQSNRSVFQTPKVTDFAFVAANRYLLRRIVTTYTTGEQVSSWEPAPPYKEFLSQWNTDQMKFLRVRAVALRYGDLRSDRETIMVGFTVPVRFRRKIIRWYAGDGMYEDYEDMDRNGYIELREGVSDWVTDGIIDEIAERMAGVVDQGLYRKTRSTTGEHESQRSQPQSTGGSQDSFREVVYPAPSPVLGQPDSYEQRLLEEHQRREADLEDQRDFLIGRMNADPDNPRWRELLEKVDPAMTPDDISWRLSRARQEHHYYSQDEIAARTYEYREYPPPGPGDHASGADRG